MLGLLISCSKPNTSSIKDITVYNMNKFTTCDQEHKMFNGISFDPIADTDRESRTADAALIISGNACKGSNGFAVCIATITSIDKDNCTFEKGALVPVTLRIDSVIESNTAFALKVGDTAKVAEYSSWFKNEEGYTVSYQDGIIPITEEGSQYIIYIYEVDENIVENFWHDLKYRVEALTIPISQNHEMTDIELYKTLGLPDDVIQCSKELINWFVNRQ